MYVIKGRCSVAAVNIFCRRARKFWVFGSNFKLMSSHAGFACLPGVCEGFFRKLRLLPTVRDIQVGLTGNSKSPVGVNVSQSGCSSPGASPVMNCRLALSGPGPSPDVSWDQLHPPSLPPHPRPRKG